MTGNTKEAIKAGTWYTISNVAIKSIGIITAPIFTRLLTTDDYGQVTNFTSWQAILFVIFGLCADYVTGRAKIDFENTFNQYLSSIQSFILIFDIVLFVVLVPFYQQISILLEIDPILLFAMCGALIFSTPLNLFQTKLRFEYKYKENVFITFSSILGSILFSLFFIYLTNKEYRADARIIGGIIPIMILGIYCFFSIIRKGAFTIKKEYFSYMFKYALPIIPHGLAMMALAQIGRIMIVKYDCMSNAGLFGIGESFATIFFLLTLSIQNAWQPWFFDKMKTQNHREIRLGTNKLTSYIAIGTILYILVAPEAFKLFTNSPFWDAIWLIPPIALASFYKFLYGYFINIELYLKKTLYIPIATILCAIVNIILNLIFLPQYGYMVTAYTALVSYLFLFIFHWIVYKKIYKKQVFDGKILFLQLFICSCFILFILLIYENITLRYILVAIITGITCYINKKSLSAIIKKYTKRFVR